MDFSTFLTLDSDAVARLLAEHSSHPLGIGIPFNGTRRWYMAAFDKSADELYTLDYPVQVFRRLREIVGMMFADGVHTVYTPIMGRDLAERGEEYMQFGAQAVASMGSDEALAWYRDQHIDAGCYGEIELLPAPVQTVIDHTRSATQDAVAPHFMRYGVFADRPLADIAARSVRLWQAEGSAPSEDRLIADYYGGPVAPVGMWIGSDQPTVFDVPLMAHGNTALYFLQFPTPYLNHQSWRRLLYDLLFIRGDQETLYPDNIATKQQITGLGIRRDGYWMPSTT